MLSVSDNTSVIVQFNHLTIPANRVEQALGKEN